jgi:hypothetical protein
LRKENFTSNKFRGLPLISILTTKVYFDTAWSFGFLCVGYVSEGHIQPIHNKGCIENGPYIHQEKKKINILA